MKIYVSGSYNEQARLREESHKLFALGHTITSTWLNETKQPAYLSEYQWYHKLAIKDLAEVAAADCIIMDVVGASSTGGRYVEWGFACGRFNMLKCLVGADRLGVFDTLADLKFTNWDEVINGFAAEYPTA